MPTGIYIRTAKHKAQIRSWAAKGHSKQSRIKAEIKLKALRRTEAYKIMISETTKIAMHRSEVRKRHLKGLKKFEKEYGRGCNFRGGQNQVGPYAIVPEVVKWGKWFTPEDGFIKEYRVANNTGKPPYFYYIDFADPIAKVAIEIDGPSHRPMARQQADKRKDAVLKSLGWKIKRIKHK